MLRPILHNPTAAGIGSWLGIITFANGVLSGLIKMTPEWFGELTWPQSILLGLAFLVASTLLLAVAANVGGRGYRYFRPISASTAAVPADESSGLDDRFLELDKKLQSVIDRQHEMKGGLASQVVNHADTAVPINQFEELRDLLGYLAKPFIQRSQAGFLETVTALRMIPAVPRGTPRDENVLGSPDGILQEAMQRNWDRITQDITNAGFDLSSLFNQIAARESVLAVNLPDDDFQWVSLDHKRNWYFWQARTELLNTWVETRKDALSRNLNYLDPDAIAALSQLPNAR